jgi:hypothetical protein
LTLSLTMEEKLLKEILAVAKENRQILNAINNQRRFSNFMFFIKWIIIAGLAYGVYTAAAPYMQTANKTMQSANEAINQLQQFSNNPFGNLQNSIKTQIENKNK